MIIPKELNQVQCRSCLQVFCCAKCRQKHEDKYHQEDAMLRKICYICNDRPFPFRRDTKITPNNLLIVHILKEHLPLQCNRCRTSFYSVKDFQNANKCFMFCDNSEKEGECHLEQSRSVASVPLPTIDDENKENSPIELPSADRVDAEAIRARRKSSLITGDMQPFAEAENKIDEVDEALLTPLTKINLRWKRKSRQSFESMLSMSDNTSEVNGSGMLRIDGVGAGPRKLVRTTSTPMYQWQLMPPGLKQPNESYSATMGQMSSIHCSSSGSETDSRTEDLGGSPQMVPNELEKVRAIIRNRSKAVATPLRQVMSKSIQRAIAQHTGVGSVYSKMLQPGTQRKMSFNSTMSSGMNSMLVSPAKDPLDLRTTPTLKRTGNRTSVRSFQAERMVRSGDPGRETVQLVVMGEPVGTNSLPKNPNSTEGSEYYETNGFAEREKQVSALEVHTADSYPVTPKASTGTALKKVSSFQALHDMQKKEESGAQNDTTEDIWGTPCGASPPARSYSCSAVGLGDTFKAYDASVEETENESGSDDVFYPVPVKGRPNIREGKGFHEGKEKSDRSTGITGGSKLWSIVSNVIRLASRSDIQEEHATVEPRASGGSNTHGGGLIQRAASFADYLKNRYTRSDGGIGRTSSSGSEEYRISHGKKRRRVASTYSCSNVPTMIATSAVPGTTKILHSPVAKRKRIQSRQPIQRLRHTSSESASSGNGASGRYE
ncbi:mitosis initiation protein fs(1)Ya [Anopheles maculipalpis]|uniref:mitosis initiation protein fs(1)Ya n=1 Tax=Anopheles maculipalpis TaxID=1496333 RepID=UPI0021598E93|nr:mitosis initiation protein fs(1)Ya [Anopheles maculipalpis]